jgi:hypothetical protein
MAVMRYDILKQSVDRLFVFESGVEAVIILGRRTLDISSVGSIVAWGYTLCGTEPLN